ncbi:SDR family oxidoreductase [Paenibacillus alvei]|uniref:SDR family oxidoreductase n=1 Tax=Paenibacillus alvei TaxID=44250 RepID=UPI001F507342|nr:NAD(P)H-binding protein [Paenibacillus alvei]
MVEGATGNVGRHIVNKLLEVGHHVRALTRNPSSTKLPEEVEVAYCDLIEPKTHEPTLNGVTVFHLITLVATVTPPLQTGPEIVGLVQKEGVR